MKSKLLSAYIEFLKFQREIAQANKINVFLNATDICLLEEIALHDAATDALTVTGAMALSKIGSPATLHRHLAKLRRHGLVEVSSVQGDTRVKRLTLSAVSVKYFESLSDAMLKAVKTL
jgi:DNA-binding MarR family transcriptional regulator